MIKLLMLLISFFVSGVTCAADQAEISSHKKRKRVEFAPEVEVISFQRPYQITDFKMDSPETGLGAQVMQARNLYPLSRSSATCVVSITQFDKGLALIKENNEKIAAGLLAKPTISKKVEKPCHEKVFSVSSRNLSISGDY